MIHAMMNSKYFHLAWLYKSLTTKNKTKITTKNYYELSQKTETYTF